MLTSENHLETTRDACIASRMGRSLPPNAKGRPARQPPLHRQGPALHRREWKLAHWSRRLIVERSQPPSSAIIEAQDRKQREEEAADYPIFALVSGHRRGRGSRRAHSITSSARAGASDGHALVGVQRQLDHRLRTSRASPTAGNGIFRCGDRAPKPPLKCANVGRDQSPGIEWPEIPAETPYLASYRKRAVCEDWMVVCAVRYEPVSDPKFPAKGHFAGNFAQNTRFCPTALVSCAVISNAWTEIP